MRAISMSTNYNSKMSDTRGSVRSFRTAGVSGFIGQTHEADLISTGPTGPAGGVLAGTYPNPDFAQITLTADKTQVGFGSTAVDSSVAIGPDADALDIESVVIGVLNSVNAEKTVSIGYNMLVSAIQAVVVGTRAFCNSAGGVVSGYTASINNSLNGIAIGRAANVQNANNALAIGNGAQASHAGAIVLGNGAMSVAGSSFSIQSANAPSVGAAVGVDYTLLIAVNGVQYKLPLKL